MKNNVPVSQVMTKNILRLNFTDDLATAEKIFKKNHIRHLPVVDKGSIVGMISSNDLLRISFADAVGPDGQEIESSVYDMFSIEQIMTSKVISIPSSTSLEDTARLFLKHEFHALPVVDNDKLVGIVTTTDVIRFFLETR